MLRGNKVVFVLIFFIGTLFICYFLFNDVMYSEIEEYRVSNYIKGEYDSEPRSIFGLVDYEKYIGVIEIPSIGLKKGFYSLDSKYNKVSNGIEILDGSVFPNYSKSVLMFASHSGTSSVSFFKKLIYLNDGDVVYVYYEGVLYLYRISGCYSSLKNGFISVKNYDSDRVLVLTTCKDDEKGMQYTCYGIGVGQRSL